MSRAHRLYEPLVRAVNPERLRDFAGVETLLAVRYEPAERLGRPLGVLDFTFERDGAFAVIALALLDPAMLIEREDDPIVWPDATARACSSAVLTRIQAEILPWLYAQTFAGGAHRELVRTFGESDRTAAFTRARSAAFLGAASYARVLTANAAAAYAARFCAQRRVAVRTLDAGAGASLLATQAREVTADLGSAALNEFARKWYGCHIFGEIDPQERFDLEIAPRETDAAVWLGLTGQSAQSVPLEIVRPAPLTVMTSFDARDAQPVARFAVRVRDRELGRRPHLGNPPAPRGESAGRILIAVRKDALERPDSDSEDAAELAQRLRAEGFSVDVRSQLAPVEYRSYDLVHVVGTFGVDDALWCLERAREAGLPSVVTPCLEDAGAGGVREMGVSTSVFSTFVDERVLNVHLEALRAGRLFTPEFPPGERHDPKPEFDARMRRVMELADVAIVSGSIEEKLLRDRFGRLGAVHLGGPHLNAVVAPEPVDEVAGSGDFVLCHAPIEPRCNQLLLVRALRELRVPLVLLGPVADAYYLEMVREQCGAGVAVIEDATPGQIATLYRRARVYADAAWIGYGTRRIAQAALHGCALAIASRRHAAALWQPGLWALDPRCVRSIAAAVGDAWTNGPASEAARACSARIAQLADPLLSLSSAAGAYALAQQLHLKHARVAAEI